jgi:hypothetical protein
MDTIGQSIWNTFGANVEFQNDFPDTVIGIDFGSSNSCMAVWRADKNRVKIIRNTSSESKSICKRFLIYFLIWIWCIYVF